MITHIRVDLFQTLIDQENYTPHFVAHVVTVIGPSECVFDKHNKWPQSLSRSITKYTKQDSDYF